jgi:hypothetical protein
VEGGEWRGPLDESLQVVVVGAETTQTGMDNERQPRGLDDSNGYNQSGGSGKRGRGQCDDVRHSGESPQRFGRRRRWVRKPKGALHNLYYLIQVLYKITK